MRAELDFTKKDMRRAYPAEPVHIMLDRYDLSSLPSEEKICCQMYHEGKSIFEICQQLHRPQIEVAILSMDLADKGNSSQGKQGYSERGKYSGRMRGKGEL